MEYEIISMYIDWLPGTNKTKKQKNGCCGQWQIPENGVKLNAASDNLKYLSQFKNVEPVD